MSRKSEYRLHDEDFCLDIATYRETTIKLLRRYARVSVELGHLPVALGREFFRARVSYCKGHTFEDAVIFSLDVERCLAKLEPIAREVLVRVTVQNYTHREAARLMRWPEWRFERCFNEAVDRLTRVLFACRMLDPKKRPESHRKKHCQEGENGIFRVSA